ncbi:preprotein translocase subunit SecE [Sedimentisphaera salicampi]|uniref:Protein translocase subunit SecE n=1 Tax=Sedimentisphaera salicampi TaxID=1941349 RepID=A0A1W6LLF2_9BACT|nr:preprotein translocase subunit SecE [Sedimentisphaera salicampi]ARN56601.1 preprotein translocase subunit SecE [Sedimentisphaera salicampi]OXU15488.1 preprotein translocase subunit SecE [Sedimentisphaera salicampi]
MQLYIYKRGQGYHTRLWTSLACFALACWGCYRLSEMLTMTGNPWIEYMVPAAVLAGLSWLIYSVQNKPNFADFLIESEGELKKVSWSSRAQIIASTMIVISVVVIISLLLGAVDIGFRSMFEYVFKIYS